MKLYVQSVLNTGDCYSCHEGMELSTVMNLLTEIGHTSIVVIDEQTFINALPQSTH